MILSNKKSELELELLWWQKELSQSSDLQFKFECVNAINQIKNKLNEVTNN